MKNLSAKLQEIIKLQDELNSSIDKDWKKNRTLQDWVRTTWTECGELMNSLPWVWWKDTPVDEENIFLETVDIVHMVVSYVILLKSKKGEDLFDYFLEQLKEPTVEKSLFSEDRIKNIVIATEQVAKYFLNDDAKRGLSYLAYLIEITAGFDKIHTLYLGKNMLNHVRQEYGYGIGKYNKVIEGEEDNYHLVRFVNEGLGIDEVELKMRELIAKYNTMI